MTTDNLQQAFLNLAICFLFWRTMKGAAFGRVPIIGLLMRLCIVLAFHQFFAGHPTLIADFIQFNQSHTADGLMVLWLLILLWAINNACRSTDWVDLRRLRALTSLKKKSADVKEKLAEAFFPLSKADARICAVHEAGHVLLYGLLNQAPESLTAYIGRKGHHESPIRGAVMWVSPQEMQSREQMCWIMCRALAGQIAEELVFGKSYDGAVGDMASWEMTAKTYLSQGEADANSYFFAAPRNLQELGQNTMALVSLKDSQRKAVRRYLEANQSVLTAIADMLVERHSLGSNDLAEYLSRCVATEGLPRAE